MAFLTNPVQLDTLLNDVENGKIQLPDFQRPWKWDDERIVALLASVIRDFPVGVMMTLETGGDTRFKPRPLAGSSGATRPPEQLLMDGQQRLTSLFQAIRSGAPVETMDTRKKKLRRWYYIDIARAVDDDIDLEDAILSVPEDRIVREDFGRGVAHDLSSPEKEAAAGMFPFRLMLNTQQTMPWAFKFTGSDPARQELWTRFADKILNKAAQYQIPVITLTKGTEKEAVCTVFEKVNTGGVPLTVFELVTASYAVDDFQLIEDWERIKKKLEDDVVLRSSDGGLGNTDFLQTVTLVSTYFRRRGRRGADPYTQPAASCKRKDILDLPLAEYEEWSPRVVDAYHWTSRFLRRQCVFQVSDIPYSTQLVALAAIRAVLGEEADTEEASEKIARWYWCGVFGEQYGGSPETRLPQDLEQVVAWVRGEREPASVGEAIFREARLGTMRTRNSAAYKGLYALLLQQGCKDWTHNRDPIDETIFREHGVGISQIFPKSWCSKNGIPGEQCDSIVNKTLLTDRTSQIVRKRSPRSYLRSLATDTGLPDNWLDDIIATHLIDPGALRDEDFPLFYKKRATRLCELIEAAMGKSAIPAAEAPESAADYEPEPEEAP